MRLLLVEDNDELSELLVKALKAAGYDADVVTTAGEARAVLLTPTTSRLCSISACPMATPFRW